MNSCFWTLYESNFKETAQGLKNSVQKFYPDIPFIDFEIPRHTGRAVNPHAYHDKDFELNDFLETLLDKGTKLLEIFDRAIYIDADSIMTGECPDFFGDFDMGVVQNNTPYIESYDRDENDDKVYLNSGLKICASKEAWQELIDQYRKVTEWNVTNLQDALNKLYHTSKFNYKLLEFPDRVYGISALQWYSGVYLDEGGLVVPIIKTTGVVGKRVNLMHFAGDFWKKDSKIQFNLIDNKDARDYLINLTKGGNNEN